MPTLYVTIGMPGSGKTHWRSRWVETATVISPDLILEEKWNYEWTPVRASSAWGTCYQALGRAITNELFNPDCNDAEYVWDAVNATPRDRSAILHVAKGAGWRVVAVYFNTPLELCCARNDERPRHRRVPQKSMGMFWANMTPPQDEEGWDDVIYVEHEE